jgi:predicted regulator of Ras-like GTPase activity (Roadblock/LC7/MglB family)
MVTLNKLLKEMADAIPGFISASVTGMDGISVAAHGAGDFTKTDALAAIGMKLVLQTIKKLGKTTFDDNLFTTNNHFILNRLLGDGSYWVTVIIDKKNGGLGNLRMMVQQFSDDIWSAIPARKR